MRNIFTLLMTLLSFSFAEAQVPSTSGTSTSNEANRLLNLENQLKAQQLVLNKQKAALDSLKDVNLVLTVHKDGYSNNVAVLTWVFGTLLAIGLFILGYVVPRWYSTEYAKAIADAKEEFKTSLNESEKRVQNLESTISQDVKKVKLRGIQNTIDFYRGMMLLMESQEPEIDTAFGWACKLFGETLNYSKVGGTADMTKHKQVAMLYMETCISKPITQFNGYEIISAETQKILNEEKDEVMLKKIKKLKAGYNKLYYAFLANKEVEDQV
jgi:hypothetical protein